MTMVEVVVVYDNVKCCVKYNNLFSYFFICKNGLFQGDVLSPILCYMYVNDCEMQLLSDNCPLSRYEC